MLTIALIDNICNIGSRKLTHNKPYSQQTVLRKEVNQCLVEKLLLNDNTPESGLLNDTGLISERLNTLLSSHLFKTRVSSERVAE
jgi:hypothetical protein